MPNRAPSIILLAQVALRRRDAAAIRECIARVESDPSVAQIGSQASLWYLTAALAALEGRTADALAAYVRTVDLAAASGAPLEAAMAALDMAATLDPEEPQVAGEIARGRALFERVRAQAWLDLLDRTLAERGAGAPSKAVPTPIEG